MLRVALHPRSEKELRHIPQEYQDAILKQLGELAEMAHPLHHRRVIQLRGRKTKDFRLRVGDYRIEFTLREPNAILVTRIEHRQAGY